MRIVDGKSQQRIKSNMTFETIRTFTLPVHSSDIAFYTAQSIGFNWNFCGWLPFWCSVETRISRLF